MKPWRVAVVLLAVGAAAPPTRAAPPAPRSCEAIAADLATARAAGQLQRVVALDAEAGLPASACTPRRLFCLGRSTALAHVEAAYAAADQGRGEEAARLFQAGRPFGAPWPLLVGLGDAADATARTTHDPARWSQASLAYQQAVAALDEPVLCPGEPPVPEPAAADQILRKMLLATLLARPVSFFHDRCAPCALAFLAHGPIDEAHPRALPITFADRSATLTPEGSDAAKGLAGCARALHWPAIDVSVHTDDRGGAAANLMLSEQRATVLRKALREAGYGGLVQARAAGKGEPLAIAEPVGLRADEIERANRRVELRAAAPSPPGLCTEDPSR